jgi:hypothetical protein
MQIVSLHFLYSQNRLWAVAISQQIAPQTSSPNSEATSNAALKTATVNRIQPGIDQAS